MKKQFAVKRGKNNAKFIISLLDGKDEEEDDDEYEYDSEYEEDRAEQVH